MFEVCLLFHSAKSDNLGVTALTVAQVELLRGIAKQLNMPMKITILGWADPRAPVITGSDIRHVAVTGRDMIDPRGALTHIRRADLAIDIGAGDSFTDIYGMKRFRRLIWLKNLVRVAGTPMVLAPQTFGPFTGRIARFWASRTIRSARIVAARDVRSVKCLANLGVGRPICLASDLALKLARVRDGKDLERTSSPRVGINVSGLLWNGGYTKDNQFSLAFDYQSMITELVDRFKAHRSNPEIWLVPHVISSAHDVEDDLAACQALAASKPNLNVAPSFSGPGQAKDFISEMDFFTGSRMHSCIAAFSSEVPVVPLGYSRKFAGLFGSLGYDHTLDCRSLQLSAVVGSVVAKYENRHQLRKDLVDSLACGDRRVARYEHAVMELIQELHHHLADTKAGAASSAG